MTVCALAVLAGCSQQSPFLQRQTQVGALRESVNQLESEKAQLERRVADLSNENSRLEDRLLQEEAHSAQLARSLRDARRISSTNELEESPSDLDRSRRTVPAARPRERKTPFAQIPGEIQPLPESESDDSFAPRRRTTPPEDEPNESDLFGSSFSLGSRGEDPAGRRWLAVNPQSGARLR